MSKLLAVRRPLLDRPGRARQSLCQSHQDGLASGVTVGLVDTYLIPFALALQASPSQVANLASLPNLLAALVQSQAAAIKDLAGGRRAAVRACVALQAGAILLMPFVPLLPAPGRLPALLALVFVYVPAGGLSGPLYNSLLCEYVPRLQRAGYFGWRHRAIGLIVVVTGLTAGLLLSAGGRHSLAVLAALLAVAGLARMWSWRALGRIYERAESPASPVGPVAAASPHADRRPQFRRLVLFNGLMSAGVNLVGPLFPMYLLNQLHFDYFTYTVLVLASHMTMYVSMARWGRAADAIGNLKIIRMAAAGLPVLPLLWLVSPNPIYLLLVQILGGWVWAAYNLCVPNYLFDAVPAPDRVRASGSFNMVNGFALFAGAALGGQLLDALPPIAGRSFFTLCLLSAAVRAVSAAWLLPRLREVRPVHERSHLDIVAGVLRLQPVPVISRLVVRPLLGRWPWKS